MSNKNRSKAAAEAILTRRQPARATPLVNVPREPAREFPDHPRVGVGGIVVHNGHALLVRRGREPLKGKWSIPGGLVEVGEELQKAVQREIKEETGLDVDALEVVGVFERIQRDPKPDPGAHHQRVRYHYVIVDYLCRLRGSQARDSKLPNLQPASDVTAAEWVPVEMINLYELPAGSDEVILRAVELVSPHLVE
ncbi:MAG TPA: NUDIX hydrolase [Terriglobia bacterium]|nr:NUDIX hydrolase [Terriglobia bacterium]